MELIIIDEQDYRKTDLSKMNEMFIKFNKQITEQMDKLFKQNLK